MKVLVLGSGPVGRALAAAWRRAGHEIELRPARDSSPAPASATASSAAPDAVMVAVADRAIREVAERLVTGGEVPRTSVLLHAAGALPPDEVFASVRDRVHGIALCHPLLSIASDDPEPLTGATFAVVGDAAGCTVALELARAAGGRPVVLAPEGLVRYHAAAVLAANHTLALVAAGVELLVAEGIPRRDAEVALGGLLGSTARNVMRLGLPAALTGPMARGDASVVSRHLEALPAAAATLYLDTAQATWELARAKGAASAESLAEIRMLIGRDKRDHD